MKKSHLYIITIFLLCVLPACKENETEVITEQKIPKMRTLLSKQWRITECFFVYREINNGLEVINTIDIFKDSFFVCIKNSPVYFNPDGTGILTGSCNPVEITTEWKFSPDSLNFYFKWKPYNLASKYDYRFQTFSEDSIILEQTDTIITQTTKYTLLQMKLEKI
jgi:hypothetical protein